MGQSGNGYLDGSVQLVLDTSNSSLKDTPRKFTNKCAEFYYKVRQNISKCPDTTHKEKMGAAFDECAGFNGTWYDLAAWSATVTGDPKSLAASFVKFKQDGKKWTMTAYDTYFATNACPVWAVSDGSSVDAPLGPKHFCEKVSEKLAELQKTVKSFQEMMATLTADQVQANIDKIKQYGENAKPLLWLAPPTIADKALALTEKGIGYADAFSKAISYLSIANQNTTVSINGKSLVLTGLQIGMGYLPILGEFYAAGIGAIPASADFAHSIVDKQVQTLAPIMGKGAKDLYPGWENLR
jgi:hypothetical protein